MTDHLRTTNLSRDAVVVTGPDAVTYLQGQLSQDVGALAVGGSAWSWLLQPAGKVDALVRVTRTGTETLLVDVDEGYGEAVLTRLTRFKLRTKAELAAGRVAVMALRGPGAIRAARVAATPDGDLADTPGPAGIAIAVTALWPGGEEAADVVVGGVWVGGVSVGGVSVGDVVVNDDTGTDDSHRSGADPTPDAWEAERIVAGVPVMGAELTEKTIPAETGLVAMTASFTKGCYTGQELVARIDSRGGNVARHLRGLRSTAPLTPGEGLTNAEGKTVGSVTSAAEHRELGPVGLGYVARSVGPEEVVSSPGGPVRVVALEA